MEGKEFYAQNTPRASHPDTPSEVEHKFKELADIASRIGLTEEEFMKYHNAGMSEKEIMRKIKKQKDNDQR